MMYYPNLHVYDYFTDGGIEFCFSLCNEVDRMMCCPNLNVYDYFTDGGIEFRFSLCDEVFKDYYFKSSLIF
jgi:hypothetical protein